MIIIKGKPVLDSELKGDSIIRRYLDTAKFLDFIHNGQLYFCRGDQFEDKYEGAFTKSIRHAIDESYRINNIDYSFSEFKRKLRERIYVNCWHKSIDDSIAMWNMYGKSECSVAITTTIEKLKEQIEIAKIPHETYIRKVRYVKHWNNPDLHINPYSNVFSYKTEAYSFEKEVRVIIDRFHEDFNFDKVDDGMRVKVDPGELMRSIVVSPEAPPWFVSLVKSVVSMHKLETPVRRSKLAYDPI